MMFQLMDNYNFMLKIFAGPTCMVMPTVHIVQRVIINISCFDHHVCKMSKIQMI